LTGACAMPLTAQKTDKNVQQKQIIGSRFVAKRAVAIIVKSSQSKVVTESVMHTRHRF